MLLARGMYIYTLTKGYNAHSTSTTVGQLHIIINIRILAYIYVRQGLGPYIIAIRLGCLQRPNCADRVHCFNIVFMFI